MEQPEDPQGKHLNYMNQTMIKTQHGIFTLIKALRQSIQARNYVFLAKDSQNYIWVVKYILVKGNENRMEQRMLFEHEHKMIKFYHEKVICNPNNRESLIQEGNLITNDGHYPVIFSLREFFMGVDMERFIRDSYEPCNELQVAFFLQQMVRNLKPFHINRLFNYDLKLENMIILFNVLPPRIYLIDFEHTCSESNEKTNKQHATGAYNYPQKKDIEKYPESVEMFALAICVLKILGIKNPFHDEKHNWVFSDQHLFEFTIHHTEFMNQHRLPALSNELFDLLRTMLKINSDKKMDLNDIEDSAFMKKYDQAIVDSSAIIWLKSRMKVLQPDIFSLRESLMGNSQMAAKGSTDGEEKSIDLSKISPMNVKAIDFKVENWKEFAASFDLIIAVADVNVLAGAIAKIFIIEFTKKNAEEPYVEDNILILGFESGLGFKALFYDLERSSDGAKTVYAVDFRLHSGTKEEFSDIKSQFLSTLKTYLA